ncbi:hypothetical protein Q4574_00860 [Aliiglaciecola sp. 3_MG-2023]|uniref:hypothetical protein n=1 Tax=Aliiglaciecola sp. 3_MG-2023 TaxID=3062644 RepID=UPI0026E23732|nr:hypothetical protein [Aliiglaciecola sp. 3_MG-2023]MDO6691806.1 hypothetical protein [Aliiglaciecola sp. 3_MG-2023]
MVRRKALKSLKELRFMDTATMNVDKSLAILNLVENKVLEELGESDTAKDYKNTMWAIKDLLFEIQEAAKDMEGDKIEYADTLEEFQAAEIAGKEENRLN